MTPARKRRWLRFSLRTLFVVVTVLACWIGWGAWTFRSATSGLDLVPFVIVSVFGVIALASAVLTWFAVRLRQRDPSDSHALASRPLRFTLRGLFAVTAILAIDFVACVKLPVLGPEFNKTTGALEFFARLPNTWEWLDRVAISVVLLAAFVAIVACAIEAHCTRGNRN
jgi:hypothetical protein